MSPKNKPCLKLISESLINKKNTMNILIGFQKVGGIHYLKKENGKHIFFTTSENANKHIFSDADSFREREKPMIHSSLRNGMIYFGFLILSILIYIRFEQEFFIGTGLFSSFAMIKSIISYIGHKKALKSIGPNML